MTQQEKENIQDDIESLKAFGAYEDDLEKQKQSPLDAFKDALKSEKRRESQQLLDDFAKAAMQGILSSSTEMRAHGASYGDDGYYPVSSLAKEAYDIATAMMNERSSRLNKQ